MILVECVLFVLTYRGCLRSWLQYDLSCPVCRQPLNEALGMAQADLESREYTATQEVPNRIPLRYVRTYIHTYIYVYCCQGRIQGWCLWCPGTTLKPETQICADGKYYITRLPVTKSNRLQFSCFNSEIPSQ